MLKQFDAGSQRGQPGRQRFQRFLGFSALVCHCFELRIEGCELLGELREVHQFDRHRIHLLSGLGSLLQSLRNALAEFIHVGTHSCNRDVKRVACVRELSGGFLLHFLGAFSGHLDFLDHSANML
ncbi:hypothetical protein D3C81_1434610 [compost metagenome]